MGELRRCARSHGGGCEMSVKSRRCGAKDAEAVVVVAVLIGFFRKYALAEEHPAHARLPLVPLQPLARRPEAVGPDAEEECEGLPLLVVRQESLAELIS